MPLLLIDRDSTLVETQSGEDFPQKASDFKPIDGMKRCIATCYELGYYIVVLSNQQGVGKFKSHKQVIEEMLYVAKLFDNKISHLYYAPQDDYAVRVNTYGMIVHNIVTGDDNYVKPGAGMALCAIKEYKENHICDSDLDVLFVGDSPEDAGMAENAGIAFMTVDEFKGKYDDT